MLMSENGSRLPTLLLLSYQYHSPDEQRHPSLFIRFSAMFLYGKSFVMGRYLIWTVRALNRAPVPYEQEARRDLSFPLFHIDST